MKTMRSHQLFGEERQGKINRALAISCVLCLMLFGFAANAHPASRSEKFGEDGDTQPEVKLSTHTPGICLNSPLALVLEITNAGQQEIKVHKSELWSRFSYTSPGSEFGGSSISCGFWDDTPQSWVTLAPGAKYFDTFLYITEGSYFKAAGTYRISTTLPYYIGDKPGGRIKSNEAEFEIYDCAAK